MTPKLIVTGSLWAVLASASFGAVVSDGSLRSGTVGNASGNYSIPVTAGFAQGKPNLFHSFKSV